MQNCDAPRADAVSQIGIIRKEPKIRRTLLGLITLVALMTLIFTPFLTAANAETAEYANWNAIVDDMQNELEQAVSAYQNNDPDQAKQRVNDAYYGYYEKLGFEKTVMAYISGDRATKVEYQFTTALKAIANQADPA
ncbi:MAG: hypothetical protein LBC43_01875, partial [Bifidobacteriaceae bacterium]|nr:hypothetical protein [Bifidobacteriaceae bacterium]